MRVMVVTVALVAMAACGGEDVPAGVYATATGSVSGGSCPVSNDEEFSVVAIAAGDSPDIIVSRPGTVSWFCAGQLSTDPAVSLIYSDDEDGYAFECSSPRGETLRFSVDHDLSGGVVELSRGDGCSGTLDAGEVGAVYCDDIVDCGDVLACGSCE